MADFIFRDTEITQLISFVNENIPTKFGRPILEYIEKIAKTREEEAASASAKVEKPDGAERV